MILLITFISSLRYLSIFQIDLYHKFVRKTQRQSLLIKTLIIDSRIKWIMLPNSESYSEEINIPAESQSQSHALTFFIWETSITRLNKEFSSNVISASTSSGCIYLVHRGGSVLTGSSYGGGVGPIWMDDLECYGNETSIQSCTRKPWGVNNCGHDEDVAVSCTPGNKGNPVNDSQRYPHGCKHLLGVFLNRMILLS